MKTDFHPSSERGHANYGWLDTHHSFSFAGYFNPLREQFGALRVLNDDMIAAGTGFDEHPHNNMEIVSIVLEGALEHRDSMGHRQVINPGDVQVMSAGTGLRHAEYNHSKDQGTAFLQIWIFPRQKGLKSRYDQISFDREKRLNKWQLLVTPDNQKQEGALWIQQDTWLSVARLEGVKQLDYRLFNNKNGVFFFVIEGAAGIAGTNLEKRDAIAVSDIENISVTTTSGAEILCIEVPMD